MPVALDLADLASEQWGLVTTAQARDVGVSAQAVARLTNQGALERMTHGVYRVAGAPPAPLDELRAAWLTLDPSRRAGERLRDPSPAVVSHRSAAAIHRLGDLEADEIEFTSGQRKQTRRPDIRIHRGKVDAGEWTVVDGLPVTTVIRTVDDLAAARLDGGHLASVVRDALTRHRVDDQQLATALRRHAHRYGAPMGDGAALVTRLLQESGIDKPIERAVELASPQAAASQIQVRQLAEQLAQLQRTVDLGALRISDQITKSPGLASAMEAIRKLPSSAVLQELARQNATLVDSSAMKAMAELARTAQSPAFQQIAKKYAEVADVSRLARTVSEAVHIPEIATPEIVLGEIDTHQEDPNS